MEIKEFYHNLPLFQNKSYVFMERDGSQFQKTEPVLTEHVMEVSISREQKRQLVCLPEYLTELILGHLLTEGIIRTCEDVAEISISESGKQAQVFLSENRAQICPEHPKVNSSCPEDLSPVTPISWEPEWIFALADRFAEGMPLHDLTFATHSCFLARGGELLFSCEDIGRHNALDKVIGYALRNGIDLKECIVYSSGRIPTDMALKAIRAGIPLLSSKASPTAAAIALAESYQLTLVCAARRDRMKVFHQPELP